MKPRPHLILYPYNSRDWLGVTANDFHDASCRPDPDGAFATCTEASVDDSVRSHRSLGNPLIATPSAVRCVGRTDDCSRLPDASCGKRSRP
jgi:hypothetical protein